MIKTHKGFGPIIPGSSVTMRDLEAPENAAYLFIGGSGWLGLQCACGFIVSGRTPAACQDGLLEHQTPATCPSYAAHVHAEDDNIVDTN